MEFSDNIVRKLKYIIAGDDLINDYKIAHALGLTKKAYSNRKVKNSLPLEAIVKFCLKKNISINYVLSEQQSNIRSVNLKDLDDVLVNTIPMIVNRHPLK